MRMSALSCSTCSKVFYDKHNRQRHKSLIHRVGGNIVVISVQESLLFPLIWSIIWVQRTEQPQKQRPIVENVVRLFKMMRHWDYTWFTCTWKWTSMNMTIVMHNSLGRAIWDDIKESIIQILSLIGTWFS